METPLPKEELAIISYPTAMLAKEKGFELATKHHYLPDDDGTLIGMGSELTGANSENDTMCAAPYQAGLQEWLRRSHNIHIDVYWDIYDKLGWCSATSEIGIYEDVDKPTMYSNTLITKDEDSYEEALEKGLVAALNIL